MSHPSTDSQFAQNFPKREIAEQLNLNLFACVQNSKENDDLIKKAPQLYIQIWQVSIEMDRFGLQSRDWNLVR